MLSYYQLLYKPGQVSSNIFKTALIFTGHTNEIWAVQFSPDGNLIASGGVDSTVKVWRRDDGTVVHNLKHPAGITFLQFSNDGNYIVTSSYDLK